MIKIAICDDEKNIRDYLSNLIRKQNMECEITEYASASEYVLTDRKDDLLFLDIEMKSASPSMDGMELAREIRSRDMIKQPIIIFVTGYETYVYDSFDVNAFQYLLKPVNEQKFSEVFQRAVKQVLLEQEQAKRNLVLQHQNINKVIPLMSIYFIESQNHKVVIHTKNEELEFYAKLEDLEMELQGQFYRIHRGYLINLAYVDEYSKAEVTLVNGAKLLISKYKYNDFVKAYHRFIR